MGRRPVAAAAPRLPAGGAAPVLPAGGGVHLGPDYKRPDLDLPAASVAADEPGALFTRERWWEVFHDDALNRLEEAALAHNSNLAQAMARVEEARAAAGVAFADRLPAVGLRSQDGKRLMTEGEELAHHYASRTQEAYKAVGFLSFELDLWGKYRRLDEAARAELLSTEAARDTIRLAVASETALAYFQLRTLQEQERIAADMLKSYERTCKVYETRYRLGQSPETTLRRFAAERDKTQAQLYDLEERRIRCEGALAVLAGFSPAGIVDGAGRAFQEGRTLGELAPPPDVPSGIPSDLLQRRPDVRSAEGRLMAANARIGAARAAFFPSFSLTAEGATPRRIWIGYSSIRRGYGTSWAGWRSRCSRAAGSRRSSAWRRPSTRKRGRPMWGACGTPSRRRATPSPGTASAARPSPPARSG